MSPVPLSTDPMREVVVTLSFSQHLMAAIEERNSRPDDNEPTHAEDERKIIM